MKEDSADIARLFLISSDGLAEYIWSKIAEPGETVLEAGTRRYAREGVVFSYENCLIAEKDAAIVGMVHSFEEVEDPDAEPTSDPVLKPYSELEDYGSLYLSGLAVVEQHRNAGIGLAFENGWSSTTRRDRIPPLAANRLLWSTGRQSTQTNPISRCRK